MLVGDWWDNGTVWTPEEKKFHKKELKRIMDLARKKKVELKEQHQKILAAIKELPEEDILKEEKKGEKKR